MNSVILSRPRRGTRNRIAASKQHLPSRRGKCKDLLPMAQPMVPGELSDRTTGQAVEVAALPMPPGLSFHP